MPDVLEAVLDNGLTVLIRESHAAPVASCWAGYRVGARNERPEITGISHWVEHMTFKRTALLGPGDLFRRVARHGGTNNGFTSDDYTIYYETLPAAELDTALVIEAERMARAVFDPEEVERERTVILAEREGSENNPHFRLSEQMGEAVFHVHPYRWPVIGMRADLERMTRDDLLAHYRTYYAPNNATVVVVGDVAAPPTLDRIRELFEGFPAQEVPPGPGDVEPPQTEERRVEVRERGAAAYLNAAYRTPAAEHPDAYALALLDAILSGGKGVSWSSGGYMGRSARIYRAVVETRLATSASSSFRFSLDPHVFSASLTLREGASREAAEEALLCCVEGVAADPPSEEELARTLRQAEAQYAYSRDGVTSQAFALLFFQMLGAWSRLEDHVGHLRAVTRDDLVRVAETYLRRDNRTVGWFIPEKAL